MQIKSEGSTIPVHDVRFHRIRGKMQFELKLGPDGRVKIDSDGKAEKKPKINYTNIKTSINSEPIADPHNRDEAFVSNSHSQIVQNSSRSAKESKKMVQCFKIEQTTSTTFVQPKGILKKTKSVGIQI